MICRLFFEILPKDKYQSESIFSLYNWLKNHLETFSKEECKTFKEDINIFFEVLIKLRPELVEDFLENLLLKLNIFCKELFLYFLNNNNALNKRITKDLIKYYTSSKQMFIENDVKTRENIKYFVENFTKENDTIIEIFLDEMRNASIKEDDFFDLHKTSKYIIFLLLLKYKKKFRINKKGQYLDKTIAACQEFIRKLKTLNYECIKLKIIFFNETEKKNFKKKIENVLYFLSNEEQLTDDIKKENEQIFQKIIEKFSGAEKLIKDLGETSYYLELFFDKNTNKMKLKKSIDNFINELWVKTLAEIDLDLSIKEKINQFNGIIEESKPILLRKRESALFNAIYNSNKQKIEEQVYLLEETEKNFKQAINLIKENPEEIQNKYFINFYYEIGYQDEKSLENEINWVIENENIKISEEQKTKILSSLKLLIKKKNIINVINAILIIVKIYEKNLHPTLEEEKYFEELNNKSELLKQKISSKEIRKIINFIGEKFNEITFYETDKNYHDYILPFFNSFNINKEAFIFFQGIRLDGIANIKEFLLDSDERELTLYEIDEFIQIIKFLNEEIMFIDSPIKLIQTFISGILDKKKFQKYLIIVKDYNKFKNLFDKFLKGENGIFNTIRDIMNDSTFQIKFSEEKNLYELTGYYNKSVIIINPELDKLNIIKSEEMDDLYERVFMSLNKDREKEYIKNFIQYYKYMTTILGIINKIFNYYGYPEEIEVWFNIRLDMKCTYSLKNYSPLDLIKVFKTKEGECFFILNKSNSKYDEIRLFYGKQLYLINKCLKEKNFDKIKDLISCVTNGLITEFNDNYKYSEEPGKSIYENMINNIKTYIKSQFEYNNKEIDNIYLNNTIKISKNNEDQNNPINIKENDYKGFYFYPSTIEENDILNIFIVLTKSIPMNNNILFCNKETLNDEMYIFLLRAIFCKSHSLFLIFIPEYINNTQKIYLVNQLRSMQKPSQMMQSCLAIIFNRSDSEFHQSIAKMAHIKLIETLPYILDYENKSLEKEINVEIISSTICGLGKSTFINNKKNKRTDLIYLPIGGDMTKEDLTKRILTSFEKVKIEKNKDYILHIDFSQTNNTEIIKDFLFKLLILKKIEIGENVIYIKKNIKIKIELANDFFSYTNEYRIFSLFMKTIVIRTINTFNFEKDEDKENIKKVSVILNSFKNNEIMSKVPDFEKDYINDENFTKGLILQYLNINNPNYYQIKSFIRILAFEFDKFNMCYGFYPEVFLENLPYLRMTKNEALNIRKLIIQYFINVTKHFTVGPFEELIKTQDDTRLVLRENNIDKEFIQKMENKIEGITYNDIKPSLVVFNLDGGSVSILTTLPEDDKEFKNLKKLYNSQNIDDFKRNKKVSGLKNLASLTSSDILAILKNFLNVNLSEKEIKDIVGNYVYTADNLIKVILIILRIKAKVPVIMMGETGCGKTRLIEMAFKLINKNKDISIKKLDIHAGTNDEDIIKFIEKTIAEVTEEDDRLYAKEISKNENKKYLNDIKNSIYTREIWIFFDEINTCNSMGLLSEILCKNSYRGIPINERFVFIAACNPYRLLTQKRKMDEILLHKRKNKNMLVYSVNPLPHSLLNFVLYFGRLKPEDEKEYIKSMVRSTMELYVNDYKNNLNDYNDLINIQTECISIAQNYLKKENDVSIVSLREVNRFLILFKFFEDFIQKRNERDPNFNEFSLLQSEIITFYKNKSKFFYHRVAVNLSLFLCYYLRLPDKNSRKCLEEKLNETNFFGKHFLKIPELEMDYVIDNFIIPIGIAKNSALKENLFSTLFCIVNKIPIIICGKPGRSKTLCIEILRNSMKGKVSSKSYLCQSFPELIIHKIQGALNTKTEDVIRAFQKARQEQNTEKGKNGELHIVLMDEMGLAELSTNNPLKVTHFELEKTGDENIPFVGITNWALDASKMNRVIYIVVQDPDLDDLIITTKEIVNSFDRHYGYYYDKYNKIFENLSKAYFSFIKKKKEKNDENKYFHGSRDFYSLIKGVISDIIKNKEKLDNIYNKDNRTDILLNICMKNIERNFGGLENTIVEFKGYFIELFNEIVNFPIYTDDNLLEYLKENLYDTKSRYLLLISDSSLSQDILKSMIEEINTQVIEEKKNIEDINLRKKEVKIFIGSKFKSDQNSTYYVDDILYKIKCQMETENIIILKDLEVVYPSLYELFNQNFTYFMNTKFARLGKSESLTLVNDKFKAIVLIDKENMPKEDPPFINRFEKHIISFYNLLNQEQLNISKEIELMFEDIKKHISQINDYQKKMGDIYYKYILNTNIKFINNEEIRGLYYIANKKGIKGKDDIIKFIFNKIVPTFTEDMMVILKNYGFKAKYDFYFENILDIYKSNYKYNLKDFIENTSYNLSIVYTFSFINDLIFEKSNEEIYNKTFKETISNKTVTNIYITEINSSKSLDNQMINFIMNNDSNLCIIKFRETDLMKLSDVYNLVDGYAKKGFNIDLNKDNKNRKKMCIILIYLTRILEITFDKNKLKNEKKYFDNSINKYFTSFLSETPQYFIDNINNKNPYFIDILTKSSEDTIAKTIITKKLITKHISSTLIFMEFFFFNVSQIKKNNNEIRINEDKNILREAFLQKYKADLVDKITMNEELKKLILKAIVNLFKNENKNIFNRIFQDNIINIQNNDFIEELSTFIEKETKLYLIKILYLFDKEQILVSFICDKDNQKSALISKKMNEYVDNINDINIDKNNFDNVNLNNKIKSSILYGIKIPFIQNNIKNDIFPFIKNEISKHYIKNESILMKKIDNEKLHLEKKKYLDCSNELKNKLKNELMNYQFISSILESGQEQLIINLFKDCFHVFLMKSGIFYNDYDSLIQLLDIIIQLRFMPMLNNDIEFDYYSNDIILSPSFIDIFKIKENNNINEIFIGKKENNKSYTDIFADVLIFLESYSKGIYSILNTFEYLNTLTEKNNLQKIRSIIINKEMYFDDNDEKFKPKINTICFYFIMESILLQITTFFKHKNFFEINNIFKNLKYHIMNWLKIDKTLSLSSKELFSYELLLNIFEYYEKQIQEIKIDEIKKDEYGIVIKLIMEGDELFLAKKNDELNNNLNEINVHLKNIFDEYSNEYTELMILLVLNRYKLIRIDKIRKNILNLLIPDEQKSENKNLLDKIYPLISLILDKSEPEINLDEKDFDIYRKKFLSFITNKKSEQYHFKKLLNKDYLHLNQVIIYYYENCCQNYFNKIGLKLKKEDKKKYIQNLCGKTSKIYLEESINYLNTYQSKIDCLNILGKHYSIAYIKRYLEIYVKTLMSNDIQYLDEKKEIDRILFSNSNSIVTKQIKYYLLKLCITLVDKNKNYENFLQFFKEDLIIDNKNEYFSDINLNDNKIFFYSMIPLTNNDKAHFLSLFKDDEKLKNFQDYKLYYETVLDKIKNEAMNDVKIPKELSDYKINDVYYTYLYFSLCKSILSKEQEGDANLVKIQLISLFNFRPNSEEQKFINLIFGDTFMDKVLPKIGIKDINEKEFQNIEILFYALRFVFGILYENNINNFYYSLLTNRAFDTIKDNMIPGKLANTNILIDSFLETKKKFNQNPDYSGYLCSCGYQYSIEDYGFPINEFNCPNCGEIIGGKNHILHRREGHLKIFFNEQYKNFYLNNTYSDKTVPFILLKDLEKKVNNEKKRLFKGLKKETKKYFLTRRIQVRETSYITFRILNFILHGFILYANLQGYLSDQYLEDNLIESMTCFDIMKADWEIIDKELKIKQIINVQVFFNVIFDKILYSMKRKKYFNDYKDLESFEKEIEVIIQTELNDNGLLNEYIKDNDIMTENLEPSDKLIILENDINNTNINNKYPDMKYFRISKLPDANDFVISFKSLEENKELYPIINYILDDKSNIKYLKYLPIINQVCNKLLNYCSYKLSREEAKKTMINKDITIIDEKVLEKFIEIYGKLRPFVEKYEHFVFKDKKGNMLFNNLKKERFLSNFCVDIGDCDYGMVLASIYTKMISWQNQFINLVIHSKNISDKNYSGLFENEIMIQDCSESDIIKLPSIDEIMNDIIIKNSSQKNFGVIIYNYDSIEKELASKYLPQIKKFISKSDTCLRYVIYQFEGFRGNKSNIITKFLEKYKPMELSSEELQIIFRYEKSVQKDKNNNFIQILFSLQVLIDFILENNYNKNELLSNIVWQNDKNENISILKDLFDYNNNKMRNIFKVGSLLNIFNIFELLCWDKIKENLINEYKKELNNNIKNKFNDFYKENEDKKCLTKIKLSTALRRFISRYLSGKRNQNEFNEKQSLLLYLSKAELWDEYKFTETKEFNDELHQLFSDEENNCLIMVGHAMELYNYLGGDNSVLNEYLDKLEEHEKIEKNEIKNEIIEIKNEIIDINEFDEDYYNEIIKEKYKDINDIIINKENEDEIIEKKEEKNYFNINNIQENVININERFEEEPLKESDYNINNINNIKQIKKIYEGKNFEEKKEADNNIYNINNNKEKENNNINEIYRDFQGEEEEEDDIDYNKRDDNNEDDKDKNIEEEENNINNINYEQEKENNNIGNADKEHQGEEEEEDEDNIDYNKRDEDNIDNDKNIEE